MDSIQPASDCEDVDHGQEIALQFLVAGSQPAHVFHAAEEALDEVAHGVDVLVVRYLDFGIGLRRDHRERAFVGDSLADCGAAVGFVRDDCCGWNVPIEKGVKRLAIMGLCASDLDA